MVTQLYLRHRIEILILSKKYPGPMNYAQHHDEVTFQLGLLMDCIHQLERDEGVRTAAKEIHA